MRKIRVISPVTNPKVMAISLPIYQSIARTDTELSIVNLDQGPETIESLYEDAIAAPQVILRAIQAEKDGQQAVIIDCMNDPGLEAVREAVRIPVVGAAQAAMMLAGILCHKFSMLSTAPEDRFAFEQLVRRYGLAEKYASTRSVDIPVADLRKKPKKLLKALLSAAKKAIEKDGAHGLVFGCTGMKGMAARLEKELKAMGHVAVVIDPSLAALKWAEMLVDLNLSHSLRTYPPVGDTLLPEHQLASSSEPDAVMGNQDRQAKIRVMVPVVRGFRKDDWLDGTLRDYASYAREGTQVEAIPIEQGP
ncbi:MAG TPA: aspartate/glutamate racemase family protein, partial [Anaerolineales bacterium]|nr:aspartate/glutamate racemase family protein [Anaerolineales bacterium]